MSEQNKALSKRFFEAWNARDMDAFDEIFASDAVDHDAQNPFAELRGPESAKRFCEMYASGYSDGRFEVHEQIAEGDFVVTRWTGKGTHDGELMGLPPTGKSVEVEGIGIDRHAGGKIAESWTCWDTLGMMQQLGAIPESQPTST
ncbi:MAG TPA: ester cyclase [Solirubrobacteraceae bacterium]|nr:ester cyclase [Solirubrobacteraceae bacterium]